MKERYEYRRHSRFPLRRRLQLVGAVILLTGLACAAILYLTAAEGPDGDAGYEMAGGQVYPVSPQESKTYIHDMEVFGGRSAVLADGFRRWFEGLWRGRALAFTVGTGAVFTAFAFYFVALRLPLPTRDRGADKEAP